MRRVLNDNERAILRGQTKELAIALVEDLAHIRRILDDRDQVAREVRYLSVTLRRILCERGLAIAASPRIGDVRLLAPDNSGAEEQLGAKDTGFFFSHGVTAARVHIRATKVNLRVKLRDWDQSRLIPRKIKHFLQQRVIFCNGLWANREDVICYIAEIGHVAHSGRPRKKDEVVTARLNDARTRLSISVEGNSVRIGPGVKMPDRKAYQYNPKSLDAVLLELLATAHYTIASPNVIALEADIRRELHDLQ